MIRIFLCLLLASLTAAASELVCERTQTAVALETIKYSVCLLREKERSNQYVGIRYARQNISQKIIRLYLRDLQSPWRYEIRLKHDGREVFSTSEKVFDVDMWVSVRPESKLVLFKSNETIEGNLFFSEIHQAVKKSFSMVNLKAKFSIWFSIFPAFLFENEDLSERDAVLARDKDRIELKSNFLPPYSDILIDWHYSKKN